MRKTILATALATLATAACFGFTSEAAEPAVRSEIIDAVNAERSAAGMQALSLRSDIEAASDARASEASNVWSHTRPDGTPWYTIDNRIFGENLAYGYDSASEVVDAWMHSDTHREVMLSEKFTGACVGVFTDENGVDYYAMEFTL